MSALAVSSLVSRHSQYSRRGLPRFPLACEIGAATISEQIGAQTSALTASGNLSNSLANIVGSQGMQGGEMAMKPYYTLSEQLMEEARIRQGLVTAANSAANADAAGQGQAAAGGLGMLGSIFGGGGGGGLGGLFG